MIDYFTAILEMFKINQTEDDESLENFRRITI